MLGNYEKQMYGTKEIDVFVPYTLNGLFITSKKDSRIDQLVHEIDELLPIETPLNKTFYKLLLSQEVIDSYRLTGSNYELADLYAPSGFNLFHKDLMEMLDVYEYAPQHMKKIGYANRYLKDLHYAMFQNHFQFYPGEFRKVQSFVGQSIEKATYIPPNPNDMIGLMDEMELFMYRDDVSVYVRSALLYYQIATALPFLIGNLELARLTSQLYLMEFDGIKHYIPLSRHLTIAEEKREEARLTGDLNGFIIYFLEAIKSAVIDAKRMIKGYNALKIKQEKLIEKSAHTIYQKRRLLEMLHVSHRVVYLENEPLQEQFNVLSKTIIKRYRDLMELGIISKKSTYFSNQYFNKAMLKLFQ
ncbi:Filamentation induced by cAMP protein Fic [Paracholeplasma brassicae]|uniref:Filamentation induced by cAMP protein Fic n=1 Tax=Acholeplasma brassicae TaxID=61635 RepID=U4KNN1_9MOLU|nr:Fic family protein [Paracholeplasma brassicae]CCV65895.1 Filamentation induced by cAMP protein Fic [Paracholeplasma brassicae]